MWIDELLYEEVRRKLPIACVDILILDERNRVLLVKRKNEPAKGQWWFPGGRIMFGETRTDAVFRKANEECGLTVAIVKELATFDLILPLSVKDGIELSHGISTFYLARHTATDEVFLDQQSSDSKWCTQLECMEMLKQPALDIFNMIISDGHLPL